MSRGGKKVIEDGVGHLNLPLSIGSGDGHKKGTP